MPSKILLSGLQPSGRPHIGNYFGAMKQFVDFQDQYDCRIFIADFHAITSTQNAKDLQENILGMAMDFLAIGLDPEKVTLYKQSDTPEVTELGWIFNCITTMPYLMRAHAFKDAEAKNKEINVGKFDYPMLMAADILITDPDVVPVGQDQKQHVEIARDTAEKFNRIFEMEIFKMPEPLIKEGVAVVPGIDGQKMSKSYGNTIPLFASNEEIKKQVMSIVTDSGSDMPTNVHAIHSLIKDKAFLDKLYDEKKGKYKDLKEALIEDLITFIAPLREKRMEYENDPGKVIEILRQGGERARKSASDKMTEVRKAIGVSIY
jgi:tryptophanyl-tRNA synthetase